MSVKLTEANKDFKKQLLEDLENYWSYMIL